MFCCIMNLYVVVNYPLTTDLYEDKYYIIAKWTKSIVELGGGDFTTWTICWRLVQWKERHLARKKVYF